MVPLLLPESIPVVPLIGAALGIPAIVGMIVLLLVQEIVRVIPLLRVVIIALVPVPPVIVLMIVVVMVVVLAPDWRVACTNY